MKLYKVTVNNDNILSYNNLHLYNFSLPTLNRVLKEYREYFPLLSSNDLSRLQEIGETVIYKENNGDFHKLIDMDHVKQKHIYTSIKRDRILSQYI